MYQRLRQAVVALQQACQVHGLQAAVAQEELEFAQAKAALPAA